MTADDHPRGDGPGAAVADLPFKRGSGATTPERLRRMAGIRRERTKPEEAVAASLRALGIGYRRNDRNLPGSPDFANRRRGFALFVHGCFWHRHEGCRLTTTPKRNREFWAAKFAKNVLRDREKERALHVLGLEVLTIWECESRDPRVLAERLLPIARTGSVHSDGDTRAMRSSAEDEWSGMRRSGVSDERPAPKVG